MDAENPIRHKSFLFAAAACRASMKVKNDKKEFVISRQLIRSATSVGANIEEAIAGQSRKDFYHKLSISYKESRESLYWIRLMEELELLSIKESSKLKEMVNELNRIIASILATMRKKYDYTR